MAWIAEKEENVGRLIVIEGLDGSGKATQSSLLAASLQKMSGQVRKISFPDYRNKSSTLVQMYLAGEIGGLNEVNAYAASTFYAADRYISYATGWEKDYLAGCTFVADRYSTSNITHQMVKLPKEGWDGFLQWVEDYEYEKLGLPRPDLVLYLDMDPETAGRLLDKRYGAGGEKDIHEADIPYLAGCRQAALYAAARLDWRVIRCFDGEGAPLSIEKIASRILDIAKTFLTQ